MPVWRHPTLPLLLSRRPPPPRQSSSSSHLDVERMRSDPNPRSLSLGVWERPHLLPRPLVRTGVGAVLLSPLHALPLSSAVAVKGGATPRVEGVPRLSHPPLPRE